jgi:hypothetical protein
MDERVGKPFCGVCLRLGDGVFWVLDLPYTYHQQHLVETSVLPACCCDIFSLGLVRIARFTTTRHAALFYCHIRTCNEQTFCACFAPVAPRTATHTPCVRAGCYRRRWLRFNDGLRSRLVERLPFPTPWVLQKENGEKRAALLSYTPLCRQRTGMDPAAPALPLPHGRSARTVLFWRA